MLEPRMAFLRAARSGPIYLNFSHQKGAAVARPQKPGYPNSKPSHGCGRILCQLLFTWIIGIDLVGATRLRRRNGPRGSITTAPFGRATALILPVSCSMDTNGASAAFRLHRAINPAR